MIDDILLEAVSRARQRTRARLVSTPVAGLEGDVQQQLGRGSHEVEIFGVIVGEEALDQLDSLQQKVSSGEEVDFSADISTALEIEKMVVVEAEFEEQGGRPNRYEYRLLLRESPPLPEPAELSPFGGLDGFDLGFDTDVLGDIMDQAGMLQDALELAGDLLDGLDMLGALSGLEAGNPLTPMQDHAGSLEGAGGGASAAGADLRNLATGGGGGDGGGEG